MIGLSKELKFSTLLCTEYTTNNCQANLFLFICSYMNESSCQLTCVCGLKQSWRGRILTVCSGSWLTVDLLWILFYYFFFFVKSIVYREEHGIGFGFSSFTDFAQRTSASHLTIKEGTSSCMCFIHLEGVLLQIDIRQLLFFSRAATPETEHSSCSEQMLLLFFLFLCCFHDATCDSKMGLSGI